MTNKSDDEEIDLDRQEEDEVETRSRLRAPVIYEIIRREGEEELERPVASLCWSGLAAGIAIGFSVLSEAILRTYLPDSAYLHIIESAGYCVGFLIVILARLQLFTENTITVVLPVLLNPSRETIGKTGRLWGYVLASNLFGCLIFAVALAMSGAIEAPVLNSAMEISRHLMENSIWEMFVKGIFAGWIIASLVWMLPTAHTASFIVITLMTYLIAVGDFTHIVAGSVEVFLLVLTAQLSLSEMIIGFFIPVLLGNIVGGTCLFAMLSYGQISQEV